jgi:hypothetical protein
MARANLMPNRFDDNLLRAGRDCRRDLSQGKTRREKNWKFSENGGQVAEGFL